MSQPYTACVNCSNWTPPLITSTGAFVDAKCKVEECWPTYIKRDKDENILYKTRTNCGQHKWRHS